MLVARRFLLFRHRMAHEPSDSAAHRPPAAAIYCTVEMPPWAPRLLDGNLSSAAAAPAAAAMAFFWRCAHDNGRTLTTPSFVLAFGRAGRAAPRVLRRPRPHDPPEGGAALSAMTTTEAKEKWMENNHVALVGQQ